MKYLFVLLLAIGAVSAYTQEDQDEALANSDVSFMNFASAEDQANIVHKLQEALKRTVEALKQKLDEGHDHGKALILRAHKLSERLHQLHADMGDQLRKTIETYRGKAKEFVTMLKEFFNRMRKPVTEAPVEPMSGSIDVDEEDEALANIDLSYVNFASSEDMDRFVKRLQEALSRTMNKVREVLDKGEKKSHELVERAHKLAMKLKAMGADLGVQVRETVKTFRGQAQEFAKTLVEFFRNLPFGRRSESKDMTEAMDEALANSDVTFMNFASSEERNRFVTRLQEALQRTVEALKKKLDQGHELGKTLILRAHKLSERLHQLHADMGDKLRQAMESYQGAAKEFVHKLAQLFNRPTFTTEATH